MSRTTVERHLVNAQLCLLSTYDGHLDDATAYVTKALGALFDLKNQLGRSSEPASSPAGLLSGGRPVVPCGHQFIRGPGLPLETCVFSAGHLGCCSWAGAVAVGGER